ncbi:histidine kinase [Nostoc sp. FACHB-152]|uniref:histidine kinase n=1 Tax=unclassified Nostoc TaxID=2593658 RepID=UPI001688FA08|nr:MULTISPECIES: histidine kinase [unclassified Nostoc]MBD2449563.1 histidine kinase [Nostoc sp. FACHB-152]MBD2470888.1 histidine kinase [Nostoc sp. FACHB-145]
MVTGIRRRSVGVFSNRRDAEEALHELKNSGFPMDRVSVIARNSNSDDIAGTQVSDRVGDKSDEGAKTGAITGGALGGLTGLLVGLGTLAIPGIGPIMLAGATATAIATTLAGAGIGAVAGSLLGALIGLGIPEERARVYNERVERGGYLIIVDGTDDEISRAEAILQRRGIEEYGIYNHPDAHGNHGTAPIHTNRRAIGVFSHRRDAEAALNELRDAGFPLNRVSLIAKDTDGHGVAGVGNKADDGAKAGAATGGALGGLGGLLVGLGALALPGIGPVIAGGAVATAIATTLAGGAIGAAAGGLVGALVGLGIPEDRARVYNDRFQRGHYLVMVDGTEAEIQHAETILKRRGIEDFGIFDATDVNRGDWNRHEETPVIESGRNYPVGSNHDPAVTIIDRRDETV